MSDLKQQQTGFGATSGRPATAGVCVSVYGNTISDLETKIILARKYKPSFIELRLDYLDDPRVEDIARISRKFIGNEILTFRSANEGGVTRVSEQKRKEIISQFVSSSSPPYVDVEIATLESSPGILEEVKSAGSRLIASSHNFRSIETPNRLKNLVRTASRLKPLFAIKVVRKAKGFDDNRVILSLYSLVNEIAPTKLIAFCAGPFGVLSRVSCVQNGSPFTYVSLPNEKTAQGQLEVGSMQSLFANW